MRRKKHKFSALVSMIAVTSLLVLYFLAVPAFWTTAAGKAFSVVWLVAALAVMAALALTVFERKRERSVLAQVYHFKAPARIVRYGSKQKGAS